jgi:hypothetical protein
MTPGRPEGIRRAVEEGIERWLQPGPFDPASKDDLPPRIGISVAAPPRVGEGVHLLSLWQRSRLPIAARIYSEAGGSITSPFRDGRWKLR